MGSFVAFDRCCGWYLRFGKWCTSRYGACARSIVDSDGAVPCAQVAVSHGARLKEYVCQFMPFKGFLATVVDKLIDPLSFFQIACAR